MNLSRNQRLFAAAYRRVTGMDPRLVEGQIIEEEPAGAENPVGHKDQNWLNIANTDEGWKAGGFWAGKSPEEAGRLSGLWTQGRLNIPGFGRASSGIVNYSHTAGQTVERQLAALQHSGWASSGYPNLGKLLRQLGNPNLPEVSGVPQATRVASELPRALEQPSGPKLSETFHTLASLEGNSSNPYAPRSEGNYRFFEALARQGEEADEKVRNQINTMRAAMRASEGESRVPNGSEVIPKGSKGHVPNARGGVGFTPAQGADYSRGVASIIAQRLDKLGRDLGIRLTGISGYRSPEHSVAVGGNANDPHTRGAASDTEGIESVPEEVLWRYGLTRPFSGARESNHIQLRGSVSWGSKQVAP